MTKEQLRKNWRRGFAVALTAAMIANSTLPATTFAAEFTAPDVEEEISLQDNTQTGSEESAFDDGSQNAESAETAGEDFSSGDEEAVPAKEVQDGDFSQTKTVDGIEVSVTADEGVFPEGANLNVRKVKKQSVIDTFEDAVQEQQKTSADDTMMEEIREELEKLADQGMDDFGVGTGEENDLQVFDITITDENGEEIQPDNSKGTATVSFSGIDTDNITEDIQIYHAEDDLTNVQALDTDAYVETGYAEATTEHFSYYCLSTWTGSTSLAINQLTGSETNLNTGIYYLKNDLTYNADKSRKNGLAIGENQTVYLYIPEGVTLTVYGQDGTDATNGGNGTEGQFGASSPFFTNGITLNENPGKATTTNGAAGGTGAIGGGAAIYVPSSAKLVVLGSGTLKAIGGNGGNASVGGEGGATNYLYFTGQYKSGKNQITSGTEYWTVSKSPLKTNMNNTSGSYNKEGTFSLRAQRASVGTGGAGGGGAAGGGAGIGSNGADGKSGVSSANANTVNANSYDKISATDAVKNSTSVNMAVKSGTIYVSGVQMNSIGGAGGSAGKTATTEATKNDSFKLWMVSGNESNLITYNVWYANGQAGGGGAAGGNGASVGTGGQGGAGGMAGDSGSLITTYVDSSASKLTSIPSAGKNGVAGSNGTSSGENLYDSQNPYNTVIFTDASSNGIQKYYLAKETVIMVPSSDISGFFGWRVTTGAETLDSSFGEHTTNSLLAGDTKIYKAGETITVDKLANGNVVLEAVIHSHSWKYESNGNKIKVYCNGENGEGVCDNYGKEKALTLTLKADNKTYDGEPVVASVENGSALKELTGDSVNINYYKTDAQGKGASKEKLSEAPKDVGTYVAKVTLGDAVAEQLFTISPCEIKEENVILNQDSFEWTGTEISPVVSVQVTLKAGKQTLTADKDYTVTGTLAATELSGTDGYTLIVSGTGNFNGSVEKIWKITKKVMTGISAAPVEVTYDGTSHGIAVTGQPDGAEVTYSMDEKNYSTEQPICKDVKKGGYTVYYKVTKENYEDYTGSTTVTINPRAISVTVKGASKIYGEADPEAFEYETKDLVGNDTLTDITVSRADGENAGTYDITATQPDDANSNYAITFTDGIFTINPKEIGIQWGNTAFTYNGAEQKPQAVATGLINGDTCELTVSGGQVNANVKDEKGNYGVYEATASEIRNPNYKLPEDNSNCKVSYTIYPKKLTSSMVTSKEVYGYTGIVVTPEIIAKDTVNQKERTLVKGTDYTVSEATGKNVGTYQVDVAGKGNYEGTVKVSYKIADTQAPTGSIKLGNTEWTEKNSPVKEISFISDRAYRNSQTLTVTAKDEEGGSGIDKVSYFLTANSTAMNKETLAALSDTKWTELKGSTITLNPGSQYVVYVKITDKSGNATYLSSDGILVDNKAPVVAGIANNKKYCTDVSFTVTDDVQLKSVTVDGTVVHPDENGTYTISAGKNEISHTILAEDVAGNKTTYEITLNTKGSHSWKTDSSTDENGWKVTTPATCETSGTQSRTCKECGFTETKSIAAFGHDIDFAKKPQFVWTVKEAEEIHNGTITVGTYTVKAVFQCTRDAKHTIEKECEEVIPNVTNSTDGTSSTISYNAKVTVRGKKFTDTKTIKLDKKPEDTNSTINTTTNVASGAPKTEIAGLDEELAKSLMTEEERANYKDNSVKTDVNVYLDVQDINGKVSEDETKKVEKELNDIITGKKNTSADLEIQTGINYVGLSMFKNVKTEKIQNDVVVDRADKTTQISETGKDITVEITLSDEQLKAAPGFTRSFYVIRIHNGIAECLDTELKGKILSFKTSKFSTYAIVHMDVKDNTPSSPGYYPVTDVVMSQDKATLTKVGEILQLTADVKPSYADNKNLTWKSSDEKVATVDKNGKVTAVANGTVTITATSADGKHTATATITVKIAPEKLTVTADKKTLTKIGDSLQITAKVEPDNAYKKLIWKSSDEKVAIVDSNGKVTAVGTGTATITVTTEDGRFSETITVTVKIPDEPTVNETTGYGRLKARSVTQTNNSIKLEWTRVSGADGYIIYGNYCNGNGKTYKYNRITTITNGKTRTWTHTKLKKATYYKYIVKAYKLVNGKKVITDTSVSVHATTTGGKYGVAKAVSIIKIGSKKNVTKVTLKKGKTAQITATEIKKDRPIKHHRNICYESSNTKVATVTPDGMIQAKGKGTCTIWVYAQNGVYKAVTVTVK